MPRSKFHPVYAIPALLLLPAPALAYIGPGAGFALGGSFIFMLAGFFLAVGALFMWPIRLLIRTLRGRRRLKKARAGRVIVLGLDGLDPLICRHGMKDGHLPNLQKLADDGGFRVLGTTWPAMSPVGWSTFATGADASRHNIFDFLARDKRTHLPVLSSTKVSTTGGVRKIGNWIISTGKQKIEFLRKSKPFWKTMAESGLQTSILRVPITFPPDKYGGHLLSAMCVPDLRGTQGTFSHYSTEAPAEGETVGGVRLTLTAGENGSYATELIGPDSPTDTDASMTFPFTVSVETSARQAKFKVGDTKFTIGEGEYSPWVQVTFKAGRAKACGICRFRVTSWSGPFSFYVTPINIDPENPSLPISNPPHYAITLAKIHGSYATLGLAEDTWALNERAIDEQAFLDQAWAIHEEREKQFFHALSRRRSGVVTCVFDATDRIQHMFFRYLDEKHPANAGKDVGKHASVIDDLYRRADDLVGRTLARIRDNDVLLVVSDHGFKTFQRCVNLNSWFRQNGYLFLKDDPDNGELPKIPGGKAEPSEIDWSRTRAYANGLAGFFINIAGRENDGIVPPDEASALKQELIEKLRGLPDTKRHLSAITELWDAAEFYTGPYRNDGPDVLYGFRVGYRAGWNVAVGRVTDEVITDNTRSWSGDHCMDPRQVPGVLFSTLPPTKDKPILEDVAPSILDLFGVATPPHMTGSSFFAAETERSGDEQE